MFGPLAPTVISSTPGRVVSPDETLDLVLELSSHPFDDDVPDPAKAWRATEEAWSRAVPPLSDTLDPKGAALAYAVMRGLTSSGGGMVAAATTSLPERAEQGRNYDYRYVWIRDQAYAGQAVAAAGGGELLDSATRFITARLLDDGPTLAPAYRTDGTTVPDQHRIDLAGYPGGFDLVGNHVNQQFQLDAFGEALLLLAAAGRPRSPRPRRSAGGAGCGRCHRKAVAGRRCRDLGDRRPGLDPQPADLCRRSSPRGPRTGSLVGSDGLAVVALGRPDRGCDCDHVAAPRRAIGNGRPRIPGLDGALLFPAIRGAVPADDPRSVATVAAVIEELSEDGYAYRFRHNDLPLSEAEGSFVLCGFVTALALDQQGQRLEAARWFERTAQCIGRRRSTPRSGT